MLQLSTWTVDETKGCGESRKIVFSLCLNSKLLDGHNVRSPLVKVIQNTVQCYLEISY